ncbi:permease prefix domain 1-containing protein [Vagococcus vulneris]|uniref:Beta-carotene 15,15'-monooxygenase n=1 Tax=Vagococcus vulneris TaxID=1977869 RepID=A0A430A1E3_9ENTE|nr:permease prefix domain 1-containing protein [Vagococcus vulneris]RSU00218.1 hypothetical protein CBF37_02670 [Vagococcus vulneris]
MDTIKSYVNTMFLNLPVTDELIQIKADMLENMEDKYLELKEKGLSDNAAIGQVISEFGNIDEIIEELDIYSSEQKSDKSHTYTEEVAELPVVTINDVESIVKEKRRIGFYVGLGVVLCALGVGGLLTAVSINTLVIGIVWFTLFVAIGVILFISAGFKNSPFEYLNKKFVISKDTKKHVEERKADFQRSFMISICLGVFLCIISVIPLIVTVFIQDRDTPALLVMTALLLIVASFGVLLFTYSGVIEGTYTQLLSSNLAYQPNEDELKKMNRSYKIDAIFWPLLTVLFFIWGFFLPGGFGVSWLVFVIGGIISQIWDVY